MRKFTALLTAILFTIMSFSQDKPAYILYNKDGKKVKYIKMLNTVSGADIILFGEFHNNPIAHWLQLELTKDLKQKRNLILGAEMIEADNQEQLNAYLQGKISAKGFDSSARLWKNYPTDYAPSWISRKRIRLFSPPPIFRAVMHHSWQKEALKY